MAFLHSSSGVVYCFAIGLGSSCATRTMITYTRIPFPRGGTFGRLSSGTEINGFYDSFNTGGQISSVGSRRKELKALGKYTEDLPGVEGGAGQLWSKVDIFQELDTDVQCTSLGDEAWGASEVAHFSYLLEKLRPPAKVSSFMRSSMTGRSSRRRRPVSRICHCQLCGRRGLLAAFVAGVLASNPTEAGASSHVENLDYNRIIKEVHPSRGTWYEEYFARVMDSGMDSYEAGVANYKRELFNSLDGGVEEVLELGIGAGPNLKYYANRPRIQSVIGVDPNPRMAKFCSSAAANAGLSESQFKFVHGVGEIIPVPDASVDAVVCTLVLCSVNDVSSTLREVKRVLKPGGSFLFVEHVAAPEGKRLRTWQRILDPLQQLFADGCHLTRDTLQEIESAEFASVESKSFTLPGAFVIGPHISGVAHTSIKTV